MIIAPNLTSLKGVWTILNNAGALPTSQLTSLDGPRLEVKIAGYNFAGLAQAPNSALVVSAGVYNFPALQSAPGAAVTVSGTGVSANLNALRDLTLGSLTLANGGTASANTLSNVDGASFLV